MTNVVPFENYKVTEALYAFADLRGFSTWAKNYPDEIKKLLEITYSLAKYFFNDGKRKKLVKFLGDGFLSVHEYSHDDKDDFSAAVDTFVNDILNFIDNFNTMVQESFLHSKHKLGIGFGVTYGYGYKFHMRGYPTDYIGVQVNIASRLCNIANPSEIVFEYDLQYKVKEIMSERLKTLKAKEDTINFKDIKDFKVYRIRDIFQELKKPEAYEALQLIIKGLKEMKIITKK